MKKIIALIFAIALVAAIVVSCKSIPETERYTNPETGPKVAVNIPELFSPDPDIENDTMTIGIRVEHDVPIKDWTITIQPNRGQAAAGGGGQGGGGQGGQGGQRDGERQASGERTGERSGERQEGQGGGRGQGRRAPFFEQTGTRTPPAEWKWDGKGTAGVMVLSAMDYRFTLSVNDIFDNNTTVQGIIDVDIIVTREGDNLRIIVPSIIFPPNSANFNLLSAEEQRSNTRILNQLARALTKFEEYRIIVEGHANPTTPPDTPQRTNENSILKSLSEQRANAVVNHLATNNGIARQRLSAIGVGGDRTVADYEDSDENWQNRRVEFLLAK
ncbi:MAG: OmpA family protein [Treponema sp.]|nr:OmpA family protein [Treponema sp.]